MNQQIISSDQSQVMKKCAVPVQKSFYLYKKKKRNFMIYSFNTEHHLKSPISSEKVLKVIMSVDDYHKKDEQLTKERFIYDKMNMN